MDQWCLYNLDVGPVWLNRAVQAAIVPLASVKLSTLAAAVATEFLRAEVHHSAMVRTANRELCMLPAVDGPLPMECTYCTYSVEELMNA